MIRTIAMIAALSLGSCASSPASTANLQPAQADSLIQTQTGKKTAFHLIDIRTPEEYGSCHLKGAVPIDFYAQDFKIKLASLPREEKILIYCRSGHRSGMALETMKEMGFLDVQDIAGGINAWRSQGLPVEP